MNDSQVIPHSRLEDLPNELFYELKSYLSLNEFYKSFYHLNSRYDNLLMSLKNLHYEIRSPVDNQRLTTACFASSIISISIPDDSDAVAIAPIFSNVCSLSLHRAIRLKPTTLPSVERIKLDLSNMRPKHGISLCDSIFSNKFPCLFSFYILHRKGKVVGHWNILINSIHHQCLTLTEFIFDIRPTVEWKMLEQFLKHMPNLQRLIVRQLNTRSRWTLSTIAKTLQTNVPHLNYLFICITSLGITTVIENNNNHHLIHPLFMHIKSKKGKSRKLYSTTIITSRIH